MPNKPFESASPLKPCPVCGKPDWCSQASDGSIFICRRVETTGAIEKKDKNGGTYFLYRQTSRNKYETTLTTKPKVQEIAIPSNDLKDAVYRRLLSQLDLSANHRSQLLDRGLTDSEIEFRGYKSLSKHGRNELVRNLANEFIREDLLKVPGFYKSGNSVLLAGSNGLLIPVRNEDRKLVALKIRQDLDPKSNLPKYIYLSSKSRGGNSSNSPVHVPLYNFVKSGVLRITEGELKADISTFLTSELTLSVPGVTSWRLALEYIYKIKPSLIKIAFDSDHRTNRHVASCLRDFIYFLHIANYEFEVELWN